MNGLEGQWTSSGMLPFGGGFLRYAAQGEGPALILLPKLGGWIADWRHVAPLLAARHKVIAIDPPGHGGSVMAAAPPYLHTVPESAAAITAVIDTLGIGRFSLAGNSLGGCIGIAIAAMWPALLDRLVLVSVSLAPRMSMAALAASDAAQPEGTYTPEGLPAPRSGDDLRRFGPISGQVVAEQNLSRAASGLWLRPSERGVGRMGIEDYLPRIAAPVLVINGAAGHYVKYIQVAERLIPSVRTTQLPEGGPFVHQEHPHPVAARIIDFLNAA